MTAVLYYGAEQYVTVPIPTHTVAGASVDPSSDAVWMAVLAAGGPSVTEDDWQAATWVTDVSTAPPSYGVRLLVDTTTLTEGQVYHLLVKIQDTLEVVILQAGQLYVAAAN